MSNVSIHIYHKNGDASGKERELVRTIFITRSSNKKLTSRQALQLIKKEVPEFRKHYGVVKTSEGWLATRSLKPLEKCSFQYIWEEVILTET
jgi:hypothetical protein